MSVTPDMARQNPAIPPPRQLRHRTYYDTGSAPMLVRITFTRLPSGVGSRCGSLRTPSNDQKTCTSGHSILVTSELIAYYVLPSSDSYIYSIHQVLLPNHAPTISSILRQVINCCLAITRKHCRVLSTGSLKLALSVDGFPDVRTNRESHITILHAWLL